MLAPAASSASGGVVAMSEAAGEGFLKRVEPLDVRKTRLFDQQSGRGPFLVLAQELLIKLLVEAPNTGAWPWLRLTAFEPSRLPGIPKGVPETCSNSCGSQLSLRWGELQVASSGEGTINKEGLQKAWEGMV